MNKFIRELRRREVFRSAGLYIGVCWILIEAGSVLLPTFDAPPWTLRALIIVTLVGFPVMLVLAWVYNLTEQGIEVQADPTDTIVAPLGSRKMDFAVIGLLTVALILSVYMNITRGPEVAENPDPVSVLIADFDNQTGNALFDGLLEQALNIGVEGAPHITSYQRNSALRVAGIIQPGTEKLDAAMSRLVAVREGINVVLVGLIQADGPGFELALRAVDPASGEDLFHVSADAKSPDAVLIAVSSLSAEVREELGDNTLDEASATSSPFTAASLEAAQAFTTAIDLEFAGKPNEAVAQYRLATDLDPNFGRAYAGWALNEFKLGNNEKAEALWQKALAMMETMTERERLRSLGVYYATVTRNYENAVQAFSELVEKYPADAAGHNNLAVAAFLSLDFKTASEEGRRIMEIYPTSRLYRSNFALYAMYSGDFAAAVEVAQLLIDDDPDYGTSYLPLAVAHIVNNEFDLAREAYGKMALATTSDNRESLATLGLADLEFYVGQFSLARDILLAGIDADIGNNRQAGAAIKNIALAQTYLAEGNQDAAASAATKALELSNRDSTKIAAADIFLQAGNMEHAAQVADELTAKLQTHSRAYGQMIHASIARTNGNYVEAIDLLRGAIELADLWMIRFELGRAYLDADFYAEALSEFLSCKERRGEASAVFLDDTPSVRYLSTLPYWTARAQASLGMQSSAAQGFEAFLALRPQGGPLADDARQRMP